MSVATLSGTSGERSTTVELVRQLISEQSLRPGDRLPSIRDLASQFGVKAGVVRDALLDAQGRGIVKVLPRAGAFVQEMATQPEETPTARFMESRLQELLSTQHQNLFHLLEARETLELESVSLAARKSEVQDLLRVRKILEEMISIAPNLRDERFVQLDMEFHLEIARLSGNLVMATMLRVILNELSSHLVELDWSPERHVQTDASHTNIYLALVDSDSGAARNELRKHLQVAFNALLEKVRRPPDKNESKKS